MRKKIKKGGAALLALAVLLAVLASGQDTAYGADAIDTSKTDCSIRFSLEKSVISEKKGDQTIGYEEYYNGLAGQTAAGASKTAINVQLYRVASVSAGGTYTVTDAFQGKENDLALSTVNGKTTAEEWQAKAETAAEVVEAGGLQAAAAQNILEKDETAESGLKDTISGLSTGLYLVYVEKDTVKTEEYVYNFTPFLVSLPGNDYDVAGDGKENSDDTWQYDVTVGLKPGRKPLLGGLEISKTLEGYNAKLGKAVFVFDITAVKGNETVYSNVVSLEFDGTEASKTVWVDGIPAGSVATVKEVYSGSSYEQASSDPQPVKIIPAGENRQSSGTVSFANRYDGRVNGGGGVENHFEYIEEDNGGRWDFIPGPGGQQASGGEGQ